MNNMNLFEPSLKAGSIVSVTDLAGPELIIERLHELGLRIGTEVMLLGQAPFNGPVLIKFKSTLMALRQEEAECTQVKLVNL
jgi:ferrous iron transport protein A